MFDSIPEDLREIIILRDGTCRFPCCDIPAQRCGIDFALPRESGGKADLANLGALCQRHSLLKDHGNWEIIDSRPNGACTWRSGLGRIYQFEPLDLLPRS